MFGFAFCAIAIAAMYWAARQSLGAGLQVLAVVGYFYGVGRGRYPDTFTHFPFDCALIVLYAVHFSRRPTPELAHRSAAAAAWTKALVIWPIICLAYSPFLSGSQPLIIQIVGLRGAALMVPCLILGAQLQRADWDRLAPTMGVLNVIALGFAAVEYLYGVAAVLPRNLATENIYQTNDIYAGTQSYHRIPAMFISSHAYGGMMILTMPLLIHGLEAGRRARLFSLAGLGAATIGIFLCGSRLPVVMLGCATIYVLFTLRLRASTLLAVCLLAACTYYLVTHNERLQRFETLGDVDMVRGRISGSVNTSFFEAMGLYPLGAGLASAFGTNIPFFLQGLAHDQIGMENEFGHTLVEQGIPGLLLLLAFIGWMLSRTRAPRTMSPAAWSFVTVLILLSWLSATGGVGILSAIPSTAFLMLITGARIASPPAKAARRALRHVGRSPSQRSFVHPALARARTTQSS